MRTTATAIQGAAIALILVSRTIGFPGLAPEIWISSPLAVLSLAVEAACVAVLAQGLARSMRYSDAQP